MHNKIIYSIYCFLIGVSVLLWLEYCSIKEHQEKLYALQDEYKKYVAYYKKCIQTKGSSTKDFFFDASSVSEKQFLVVNRDLPYLKQGALELSSDTLKPAIIKLYEYNDADIISEKNEQAGKIKLQWPIDCDKFWISSKFGIRKKRNGTVGFHYGLDMAALKQTLVKAAMDGVIIEAGYSPGGYGNSVVMLHATEKIMTRYAHLDSILVKVGDRIKVHQGIGRVGNTGYVLGTNGNASNATHLHFEVIVGKKRIDPLLLLT